MVAVIFSNAAAVSSREAAVFMIHYSMYLHLIKDFGNWPVT